MLPREDSISIAIWKENCHDQRNFRLLYDENLGIYPAMNIGGNAATGKYLAFWNGGERITGVAQFEKLIAYLEASSSSQVITQGEIEWLPGHFQDLTTYRKFLSGSRSNFISHQTYFIARENFIRLKGFSEDFKVAGDTDLILRMSDLGVDVALELRPVWVEESKFASQYQRIARIENLKIGLKYLFKRKTFPRLFHLIYEETVSGIKMLTRNFEISSYRFSFFGGNQGIHKELGLANTKASLGRLKAAQAFAKAYSKFAFENAPQKIGIIGGSLGDLEAQYLLSTNPIADFRVLGIENSDDYLDLNQPGDSCLDFDLILVSQVLEHIWNHENFFDALVSNVRPGGLIWVGCPASNKVHGSPEYFSAGFVSDYLTKNFSRRNLRTLSCGGFGTKRLYIATHLIPGWLTPRGHSFPFLFAFEERRVFSRLILWIRYLPNLIYLAFLNANESPNSRWQTESWWLGQKNL